MWGPWVNLLPTRRPPSAAWCMGKAQLKALLQLGCTDTLMVRCHEQYAGICLEEAEKGFDSCKPCRAEKACRKSVCNTANGKP